jgi:DUF917 family protein
MAVSINDPAIRFIQIHLGEVGFAREQVCIDGFEETGDETQARHFTKSWSEFDRSGEEVALVKAKR